VGQALVSVGQLAAMVQELKIAGKLADWSGA
jgi:hypothetical protein